MITALQKLEIYRDFLVRWTNEGQDWSFFGGKMPPSRYESLQFVLGAMEGRRRCRILELGTLRSYVHGGHPGCDRPDDHLWDLGKPELWDWGSGCFSRVVASCLSHLEPEIHTVDVNPEHIRRCRVMTADLSEWFSYHVADSLAFLEHAEGPFDLIYHDTGDMTPIEPSVQLQLAEVGAVVRRNLLGEDGMLLLDDVRNTTPFKFGDSSGMGKAGKSLPYLLSNGFIVVFDGYQVVLRRPSAEGSGAA